MAARTYYHPRFFQSLQYTIANNIQNGHSLVQQHKKNMKNATHMPIYSAFSIRIKDGGHFPKWPLAQTITQVFFNHYTITNNTQMGDSLVNE